MRTAKRQRSIEKYKEELKKQRTLKNEKTCVKNTYKTKDLFEKFKIEQEKAAHETKLIQEARVRRDANLVASSLIKSEMALLNPGKCPVCFAFGGHPVGFDCYYESRIEENITYFSTEGEMIGRHFNTSFALTATDHADMKRRSTESYNVLKAIAHISLLVTATIKSLSESHTAAERVKCRTDMLDALDSLNMITGRIPEEHERSFRESVNRVIERIDCPNSEEIVPN